MMSLNYTDMHQTASLLFRWLGSFWTHTVNRNSREAAKNIVRGATLAAAQQQLDMLESLKFHDRRNVPVYHRQRWTPILIYKDERNTGGATLVKLESEGGSHGYTLANDTTLVLGGPTPETGYVYYPIDISDLKAMPSCICDSIYSPTKVLVRDRDFVLRDGCVIFREGDDPFTYGTFNVNTDPGLNKEECVLWFFNAEVDNNNVYDAIGHVVGTHTESSEIAKRIMNLVWDCYTSEANAGILSSLIGALYNIPTCLTEEELVELVREDGLVVTDKNVYMADYSKISVAPGSVVKYGDAFDTRLRIYTYPFTDSQLEGVTIEQAIPSLTLPSSMFIPSIKTPASLNWNPTDIVDANGGVAPVRPRFQMFSDVESDDLFWNHFWTECEKVSSTQALSCFSGYITYNSGAALPGTIKPLEWYLQTLSGPNTVIARVDAQPTGAVNLGLSQLLPAHARLVVLEQSSFSDTASTVEEDEYILADQVENDSTGDGVSITDKVLALRWI